MSQPTSSDNQPDFTENGAADPTKAEGFGVSEKESERLKQEIDDLKDKYVRAVAEMENMRRRLDRERSDLIKFALEGMLKDLLPTLDSLDKALPEGKTNGGAPDTGGLKDASEGSYYTGMLMVKKQLFDVLRKHGLETVAAKGEAFDPNVHQAIQRIESDTVDKDQVNDEFARGYTLHGRLLRPAMVSVLTPAGG